MLAPAVVHSMVTSIVPASYEPEGKTNVGVATLGKVVVVLEVVVVVEVAAGEVVVEVLVVVEVVVPVVDVVVVEVVVVSSTSTALPQLPTAKAKIKSKDKYKPPKINFLFILHFPLSI